MSVKKRQSILLGTVIMCATFVLISISWAAFSSTLTVGGNADISAQSWDIDFTNTVGTKWTTAQKLSGTSVSLAELPASTDTSAFSLPKDGEASGFLGTLKMSGDKITYTWYVQNFGTLDATYSINGVIATSTYSSGSNVDITCNTSDNSTDKTFCNNYVKTTVTVDGDVTTPSSSYSLGKAGSSTDHATVVLTIEITGTNQIYTGTLANHYDNNTRATLLSNVQKLGSSNGDLNISVKGLTITEKQNIVESETTTTSPYNQYINKTYTYSYTGSYQEFKVEYPGYYEVELWGAQGNYGTRLRALGGNGAYTKGTIKLEENSILYIYVGQNKTEAITSSWNAGSTGGTKTDSTNDGGVNGYGGGGATDIRLTSGDWNNSVSLASRIMVAAGGGGATDYAYPVAGGTAGGLNGASGLVGYYPDRTAHTILPTGGTQIAGGTASSQYYDDTHKGSNGSFGVGGNGGNYYGSGGGGGYYGGAGGGASAGVVDSGAGGSSYISGYTGCVAITSSTSITPKSGCTSGTTDIECSYHYSGYKFINTEMIAGNSAMPTHDGTGTMTGNTGNGYAKITYLGESI